MLWAKQLCTPSALLSLGSYIVTAGNRVFFSGMASSAHCWPEYELSKESADVECHELRDINRLNIAGNNVQQLGLVWSCYFWLPQKALCSFVGTILYRNYIVVSRSAHFHCLHLHLVYSQFSRLWVFNLPRERPRVVVCQTLHQQCVSVFWSLKNAQDLRNATVFKVWK